MTFNRADWEFLNSIFVFGIGLKTKICFFPHRFLCKLKEPELLEPLMPTIRSCLEHRHSYVRRNAVLAIFTIYKNFDFLIPDAPELIANFLDGEQDMSCKRNAFMMLIHADQEYISISELLNNAE